MFRKHLALLVLILIVGLISFLNYRPGTWLIGWDNLHPEFNFSLNIKRSIFAVWQEYQGLGLLGGMGHASDLPRQLFLWLCSLFLATSFLRYFYTFLMLFIGPLGVYFLLLHLTKKKLASLFASLFYLLNLGTMQTFYVPFSAYTTHYGFLPWLIYGLIRYLQRPIRKNLFWFLIVNILALPQGYVPTIFLVYLMTIASFILFRKRKVVSKILLVIFCVNAFWLLPFLYFTFTNSKVVLQAKINRMISEEVFLRNKMFGSLNDVFLLRGFWFDNKDLSEKGDFFFMLEPWIEHLEKPFIKSIGYLFFMIILLGIFNSLSKKRLWFFHSFLFLFIFSFSMLAIATPPFSWLNSLLRDYIPLFGQVFRFPFTKFSILALFSYAIFFGLGVELIFLTISRLSKKAPLFLAALFLILLVVFNLPSFQGDFIYNRARLELPREYFDLFDFFKKQDPAARIANFPQAWHWGWSYYKWGYSGSGFLWYGIEQPILDRAFDVWSDKSEGYYWQISYATNSSNLTLFEKVLEKYQINWILVDENIYAIGPVKALLIEGLEEMLEKSKMVSLVASFGKVKVYQVNLPLKAEKFTFLVDRPLMAEPSYKWANEDRVFLENGVYYSDPQFSTSTFLPNYYYPFRELFTNNYVEDKNWQLEIEDEVLFFKTKLPADNKWRKEALNLDSLETRREIILYRYDLETYELPLQINISGKELEVQVPKHNLLRPEDFDLSQKIGKKETCGQVKKGKYDLEVIEGERKFLRLSSENTSSCTAFNYSYLSHDYAYLLEIESRNMSGRPLFFYVLNETTKKGAFENLLPESKDWSKSYYVLPPGSPYGTGWSLHFDNVSIGQDKSVNDIGSIKIYPIPFDFLKRLRFASSASAGDFNKELLVYSQSYDPGWVAFVGRKKIKEHVLVNNWANGWLIEPGQKEKVKIIYWPQYLEYLGFLLVLSFFFWYNFLSGKSTDLRN